MYSQFSWWNRLSVGTLYTYYLLVRPAKAAEQWVSTINVKILVGIGWCFIEL